MLWTVGIVSVVVTFPSSSPLVKLLIGDYSKGNATFVLDLLQYSSRTEPVYLINNLLHRSAVLPVNPVTQPLGVWASFPSLHD